MRGQRRKTSSTGIRKSGLEQLEPRRLMTCDMEAFHPDILFGEDGALHHLQQTIDSATLLATQIPIVGDKLADTVPYGVEIRESLADAYDDAAGEVQDRIVTAFTEVLGESNYAFLDEVIDLELDSEACEAVVTLDLSRTVGAWEVPGIQFDVGLQSLPIYASGDIEGLQMDMGFDLTPLQISLDLNSGDIGLDTSDTSFAFELNAGFSGDAEISAQVGFLQMNISDGLGLEPAEDGRSGLSMSVGVDFGEGFAVDSVDFEGNANLMLHMQTEIVDNLPSISTDFILEYDLAGGEAPNVRFENVSLGLGDVITEFLGPVVDLLDPVIEPIGTVNEVLVGPIPVVSDLAGRDISVMDIANGLNDVDALPADYGAYVSVLDIVTRVIEFAEMFETECVGGDCSEVMINVGDLSLSETNGDLRNLDPKAFEPEVFEKSISSLSVGDFSQFDGFADRIEQTEFPPGLPPEIKSSIVDGLRELGSQGASLTFPILEDPAGVLFQVLAGQNADLVRADASIELGQSDVDISGPLPIGIDGGLRGGFAPSLHLGLGYDTFGLRRFLQNRKDGTATGVHFLDGFYITDESDLNVDGKLEAFVALNAPVFSVDVSGGVNAGIRADVIGSDEDPSQPDEDGEPEKVRFASEMTSCAFDLTGGVNVGIAVTAKLGVQLGPIFLGTEHRWDIANFEVASFDRGCVENPYFSPEGDMAPVLAELNEDTGVLTLLAGPRGIDRSISPAEIHEHFIVSANPTIDGGVQVNAFGRVQTFAGVNRIEADMGSGFDNVTITEGVTADVQLRGGDADDILRSYGSGSSTLRGEDGNDIIIGGTGDNFLFGGIGDDNITGVGNESSTIEIHGEAGADVLNGGFGTSLLLGGAGPDTILGGTGESEIHGGADDDVVFGGLGFNRIFGDAGDDRITAGPDGNAIDGGTDNDSFFTGEGSSTINGGQGDDELTWDMGDGPVTFDGGIGFDSIGMFGADENDTFVLTSQSGDLRVMGPGVEGPVETISSGVEGVSVDGLFGADRILVQPLAGSGIQRVNLNLTDNLARDGIEDVISIHGSPLQDELLVENVEVELIETGSEGRPVLGGVMRISGFQGHALTVTDPYEIFAMNFEDRLLVNTHDANDLVTVRGATGPTWLNTSAGNDIVEVEAIELADPKAESGDYFSEIHVDAGSGTNGLVVDELGTNVDDSILVTDKVISSLLLPGVNYSSSNAGSFGLGIEVIAGDQRDTIDVTSTRRDATTTIVASGGDDALTVDSDTGSAGSEGNLNAIRGTLVLDGGNGQNELTLVDTTDSTPSAETTLQGAQVETLDAVKIDGFAGEADEVAVFVVDRADDQLNLVGSDQTEMTERFVLLDTIQGQTTIDDRQGNADYIIESSRGELHVIGGLGDELIQVTPSTQNWGDLLGSLSVDAGDGNDRVHVSDEATAELTSYEVDGSALRRGPAFSGTISFDANLETINLDGANANSVLTLAESPSVTLVNADLGEGSNLAVGALTGTNWQIFGDDEVRMEGGVRVSNVQTLASGGGDNVYSILNEGNISGSIQGSDEGTDTLDYSNFEGSVTIDLESQSSTNVGAFDRIDAFVGGGSEDALAGPAGDANWAIDGPLAGTVQIDGGGDEWSFQSVEQLMGSGGEDNFLIRNTGEIQSISGGAGIDRINYSTFSSDVLVDLQDGVATNVSNLVEIENATGGSGNDMLLGDDQDNELNGQSGDDIVVGGGGDDTLNGNRGLDVLIGGAGSDTINGGQDEDVLFAASTIYDRLPSTLAGIRRTWTDRTATYGQRISTLTAPNPRLSLNDQSVLSDRDVDNVFGGTGFDWFWTDTDEEVKDWVFGEIID